MNELACKIQDSELEVMRVLWNEREPMPLIEIRRILSERCGWENSTIKTLLRRLQDKSIVRLVSRGIYSAVVTEAEYNEWSAQTFLNKIFSGSATKLMAALIAGGHLNEKDVAELSEMFNQGKGCE